MRSESPLRPLQVATRPLVQTTQKQENETKIEPQPASRVLASHAYSFWKVGFSPAIPRSRRARLLGTNPQLTLTPRARTASTLETRIRTAFVRSPAGDSSGRTQSQKLFSASCRPTSPRFAVIHWLVAAVTDISNSVSASFSWACA